MNLKEKFKEDTGWETERMYRHFDNKYVYWLEQKVFDLEKRLNQEVAVEPICDHDFEADHKVVYCTKCGWTEKVY